MVRKKSRYMLVEVMYNSNNLVYPIAQGKLYQELASAYVDCFGEYGFALVKRSINIRYVNEETKMCLIRIRRGAERQLSNVLLTMKTLAGQPMKMITRHVSGSIRCAQKFWLRYNRRLIGESLRTCSNPEVKAKLIDKLKAVKAVDFDALFQKYNVERMAKPKAITNPISKNSANLSL